MPQAPPADEDAGQRQKRRVYICSFFIAHAKTTELIQPREGTFHEPQPATVLGIAHCEQRQNTAATQRATDLLRIVGPLSEDTSRAATRPTLHPLKWWDRLNQRQSLSGIVAIGPG